MTEISLSVITRGEFMEARSGDDDDYLYRNSQL